MRILNLSLSYHFKSKEEIVKIVEELEKQFDEPIQDFISKVDFVRIPRSKTNSQASYNSEKHSIDINAATSKNEKVSLAHEVIHAIQDKQKRLPEKTINNLFLGYYEQPHEQEAEETAVKLYGNVNDKSKQTNLKETALDVSQWQTYVRLLEVK